MGAKLRTVLAHRGHLGCRTRLRAPTAPSPGSPSNGQQSKRALRVPVFKGTKIKAYRLKVKKYYQDNKDIKQSSNQSH
jgi:hypothetical protein